jgi:hypothetical protein
VRSATPPTASGEGGHVTPGGLLQSYHAVTVGERECNQRDAARDRINTGVYVFTRVNASGIRQLREKYSVRGYRRGNLGCCGVNVLKTKSRGGMGIADALTRVASAAVAVNGLRFASMNAPENGAPLTAILAAADLQR